MPREIAYTRLPNFDEEWGKSFIAKMRQHMEQLYASVYDEDTADPVQLLPEFPFCGCEECDERERYLLAMILIIEGYEAGKVTLVADE
jgi:hypothetical protein